MKHKVLTIGSAMRDIFIEHSGQETIELETRQGKQSFILLREGAKVEVDTIEYYTGGGSTNSATTFAHHGIHTFAFFKTGDDAEADFIIDKLAQEGIDTSYVVRSSDMMTGASFIVPCREGDRTMLVYRGANLEMKKDEIPFNIFEDIDQIYVTSLSGTTAKLLLPIAQAAQKVETVVAVNPGMSQLVAGADELREALPYVDILILNAQEANTFMGSLVQTDVEMQTKALEAKMHKKKEDIPELLGSPLTYQSIHFDTKQFFTEVLSRGPKIVVVTNGAEGVYVATKDRIYFHPAGNVKVVSTLGAGDSFGSCFVSSLMQGNAIKEALVKGILNSASVIQYLDAKNGILSHDALEEQFAKIGTHQIEEYFF